MKLKSSKLKTRWKQGVSVIALTAFTAILAHTDGVTLARTNGNGWVIKRNDKVDSPIFKQKPLMAQVEMAAEFKDFYI